MSILFILQTRLFRLMMILTVVGCRADSGYREEAKEPILTFKAQQNIVRGQCTGSGNVWIDSQPVGQQCQTPAAACPLIKGEGALWVALESSGKGICLNIQEQCERKKDGSEWRGDRCLSPRQVCTLDQKRWSQGECLSEQQFCERKSAYFLWSSESQTCIEKNYQHFCQDIKSQTKPKGDAVPPQLQISFSIVEKLAVPSELQNDCVEAFAHLKELEQFVAGKDVAAAAEMSTLAPLRGLVKLEKLTVEGHKVSDISALETMSSLRELVLAENEVENLQPLAGLGELQVLILASNKIKTLNALASLKNLKYLDLQANQISSVEPLKELTSLEELILKGNRVKSFAPLCSLTQMSRDRFSGSFNFSEKGSHSRTESNCPTTNCGSPAIVDFCSEL